MLQFFAVNGNKILFSFERNAFSLEPRHVLVISRYEGKWLLTDHSMRGLEFPGGKLEAGESVEETAEREVYEETGGLIKSLEFIGEYYVDDEQNGPFVKVILYADIHTLENKNDFMETNGPVLKEGDLLKELTNPEYSFIMKDQVVPLALAKINEKY